MHAVDVVLAAGVPCPDLSALKPVMYRLVPEGCTRAISASVGSMPARPWLRARDNGSGKCWRKSWLLPSADGGCLRDQGGVGPLAKPPLEICRAMPGCWCRNGVWGAGIRRRGDTHG